MRKLLLISLFLLISSPVYGLIVTENVDKDDFLYEVPYKFSTSNMGTSLSATTVSIVAAEVPFEYVIPRGGRIVGMSVSSTEVITDGGATFDVAINGNVTGIQAVLDVVTRTAVGISGSGGTQYGYIRHDRDDTTVEQGFRASNDRGGYHDAEHPYGRATPLTAGNRISAIVTTSDSFTPIVADYVVTVYVLE